MSEPHRRWSFGVSYVVGFAILSMCVSAAPVVAQVLYGSVVGMVKDAQGAAVPGATISIVNKETNLTRDTVTNTEGAYSLINVPPGSYDVKITLQGFREGVRSNVPVTIGQISRVDMSLEVGTLTETVTVASEAQLLQTDKADVSTELKSAELTAMPLNRFRNYQALMNLVPGTTPMAFGNAETDTASRMKAGVLQAHGAVAAEPMMAVDNVVKAVLFMASLPLDANVQFMTVMATNMPFIGRG